MEREQRKEWKPMSWEAFQYMPQTEQEAFLRYISDYFHVGCSMIASDLFGISSNTLYRHIKFNHLDFPKSRGGRIADVVLLNWKRWIASGKSDGAPKAGAAGTERPHAFHTAKSIDRIVESMQDRYGDVRVTITIEPVRKA